MLGSPSYLNKPQRWRRQPISKEKWKYPLWKNRKLGFVSRCPFRFVRALNSLEAAHGITLKSWCKPQRISFGLRLPSTIRLPLLIALDFFTEINQAGRLWKF